MVHQRGPKKTGKPFLKPGQRSLIKSERRALQLFGGDLQDAKEEAFIRMVCDGLSLGVAYVRAGFTSKASHAARNLFNEPRIQRRAEAVLEARRTQGVVTLPEVTDMLKRVFAGANSEGEYSAAHNAAFSLARLYGHVTDKATLEVLRKPSREPDAPSEMVLGDWVSSLPGQTIDASPVEQGLQQGSKGPPRSASAPLLGSGPSSPELYAYNSGPDEGSSPELPAGNSDGLPNDFNGLAASRDGDGTGNGAPVPPVTGTPHRRGRSDPLVVSRETKRGVPPIRNKRVPSGTKRVPVKKRGKRKRTLVSRIPSEARTKGPKGPKFPSAKDLFG